MPPGPISGPRPIPFSYLDIDGTLAANSDAKVASQKAVKTYVDSVVIAPSRQTFSDADDSLMAGTTTLAQTGTMTTPRTITVSPASQFPNGTGFWFVDESGTVNATNYVIFQPATGEAINGVATGTAPPPYVAYKSRTLYYFESDGTGNWTVSEPDIYGIAYGNDLAGTPDIRTSGIIASLTDLTGGVFQVTFAFDLGDVNYGVLVSVSGRTGNVTGRNWIAMVDSSAILSTGFNVLTKSFNPGTLGVVLPTWDSGTPANLAVTVYRMI